MADMADMAEGEELPLSIPVKAVSEHFTCPICMERLSQTYITPCGHRYCGICIKECVNRRSKCPCCNTKVTADKLYPDWAFDNLISMVSTEKSKAEDQYFVKLIQEAGHHEHEGANHREESPIVGTLQKHLKTGLATHEQYYQDFKREFTQRIQEVNLQMEALQGGGDDVLLAQQLQELEVKKQTLHTELRTCTQLLVDAYDKYLADHLPTPSLLPVTVSVRLQGKNVSLPDIKIKPHSSISEIKDVIAMAMEARGDPIASFPDDQVQFVLLGPVEKGREISAELLEELLQSPDSMERSEVIRLLPRGCHPLLEFGVKPGSEVVVAGPLKLESEMPKQCFAQTFVKDKGQSMDYFTCKDCAFKWVCRSCKDFCHKDHQTVPYIMGHQPTWACCYCPRKKKCQLGELRT
ncbi:tripartite motif-containing protein 26-like [Acanthaster planci]|uniref:Tripartite motif-containing protein 26-like n=1 Tax=Acanthaster planci TaxID=133434 RepID=A0A8B7Y4Z0_ACAPL|nr:tripartite motif-containing protein 26-like [Acanthaster planci]